MPSAPPDKSCAACGRTITWRKKWARDWDQVRYCSDACRRAKVRPVDVELERALLRLLADLPGGATVPTAEAAAAVDPPDGVSLQERARAAARRLAVRGEVEIVRRGRVVADVSRARGPLHVRRAPTGRTGP